MPLLSFVFLPTVERGTKEPSEVPALRWGYLNDVLVYAFVKK